MIKVIQMNLYNLKLNSNWFTLFNNSVAYHKNLHLKYNFLVLKCIGIKCIKLLNVLNTFSIKMYLVLKWSKEEKPEEFSRY